MPRRRAVAWIASAGLAAAAAIALGAWALRPSSLTQLLSTAAGQRQALTLADDTQVVLNARTSLQVELGARERRVRLASGEAFFTVSKDARRPFIVETPAGSVRVTGTVFNVRTESPGDLEVTVIEGAVQVHPGEGADAIAATPHALTARDHLTAAQGAVQVRKLSPTELDDALAWREGLIVFRGTPLAVALARFERHHGRRIIVSAGVTAAGLKVGGVKNLDHLDVFLADLRQTFPDLQITENPSGGVRVSLRGEQP